MAKKRSLLWEIRKDSKTKGYLFGTMHVPSKIAFSNFGKLESLLGTCDAYMPEMLLDASSQQLMQTKIVLDHEHRWSALVSEKQFDKMDNIFMRAFGMSLRQYEYLVPILVLNLMTQSALGVPVQDQDAPMDVELWNLANKLNLMLLEAESTERHCAVLDEIPMEYQLKLLKKSLRNVPKLRKQTKAMLTAYLAQDIHGLYARSKKSLGALREVMLYNRNKEMLDNITAALVEHKVFVAVGAAHFSGKKGLLSGLKKQNYKLIPLPTVLES